MNRLQWLIAWAQAHNWRVWRPIYRERFINLIDGPTVVSPLTLNKDKHITVKIEPLT